MTSCRLNVVPAQTLQSRAFHRRAHRDSSQRWVMLAAMEWTGAKGLRMAQIGRAVRWAPKDEHRAGGEPTEAQEGQEGCQARQEPEQEEEARKQEEGEEGQEAEQQQRQQQQQQQQLRGELERPACHTEADCEAACERDANGHAEGSSQEEAGSCSSF